MARRERLRKPVGGFKMAAQHPSRDLGRTLPAYYSSEEENLSEEDGNSYSPISDLSFTPNQSLDSPPHLKDRAPPNLVQQRKAVRPTPARSGIPPVPALPKLTIPLPASSDTKLRHVDSAPPSITLASADKPSRGPETPIKIATPVTYSVPRARPSVISIPSPASRHSLNAARRPNSLPHPPPLPQRSDRRVSGTSVKSLPAQANSLRNSTLVGSAEKATGLPKDPTNFRRLQVAAIRRKQMMEAQAASLNDSPITTEVVIPSHFNSQTPSASPRSSHINSSATPRSSIRAPPPCLSQSPRQTTPPMGEAVPEPLLPVDVKNSKSHTHKRRPSIGLALRSVSSALRGKTASVGSQGSSSPISVSSNHMDTQSGSVPSPSSTSPQPLHLGQGSESPGGTSRLRRVRTTIGL